MSKKEKFLKTQGPQIIVLGTFKNEHDEEYLVYRLDIEPIKHMVFVTGDELDWTTECYKYNGNGMLICEFALNKYETERLEDIIKNNE